MLKKIIEKWLKAEYIRKDSIEAEIYKARCEEAERQEKRKNEEIDHIIDIKDQERNIEVSALRADVKRLNDMLDDFDKHKREMNLFEVQNKETAKINFTVSIELKYYMKRLLDTVAELSGKINGIETKARERYQKHQIPD